MNSKLKIFMRNLIENKDTINQYVDSLYEDKNDDDINEMLGVLKKKGYINCLYADNRAYNVSLTFEGGNLSISDLKLSDKEELLILIDNIDEINKLFHSVDSYFDYEEIYDIPKFQEWLQQIKMYLQNIFDDTHDTFILDTINICKSNMNGMNDRHIFNKITGALKSIKININKYYGKPNEIQKKEMKCSEKLPLIFISHSSKDKEFAKLIVDLLKEMGLSQKQVFCSSIPGYDIGLSEDIIETLYNKFNEYNLYMIFMHSPNYYSSPVSLNEMGAAWALKNKFCSILLPGFEFTDMKGVVNSSKISLKVDLDRKEVQNKLNLLYDDLADYFNIDRNTSILWENSRDSFIDKINTLVVDTNHAISQEEISILLEANKDKKGAVLIIQNQEGTVIQAGNTTLNEPGIRRDEVKIYDAVMNLIKNGFLSQSDNKGSIFQLTNDAYNYIDKLNSK